MPCSLRWTGAEDHGYVRMPPVKKTVAAHLCPALAKTMGSDISLHSKPCRMDSPSSQQGLLLRLGREPLPYTLWRCFKCSRPSSCSSWRAGPSHRKRWTICVRPRIFRCPGDWPNHGVHGSPAEASMANVPITPSGLLGVVESIIDCDSVCVLACCSIKTHTSSQKELFPPHSVSAMQLAPPQSSAEPPPTQRIVAHHLPSVNQAIKVVISVPENVGSYSGNLALVTRCDKARVYPSIQTQTAPFQKSGAVSNIASKRVGSETRGTHSAWKRSDRKKSLLNERESGFYSRYFVITKREWEASPDSRTQTHQQTAWQASVQDVNAKTDPGTNSPRGLVCVCVFKGLRIFTFRFTASQTLSEVCFRGHSVPILCSPIRAGFGPTHFFEVHRCSTFPPQNERDAHSKLFGRLADFSSVPGHAN